MWDSKTIAKAIRDVELDVKLEANFIHLKLFDLTMQFGVGTDGKGNTVLVLPGQKNSLAFETEFANYDPWSDLVVFESHEDLRGVSVLRCAIDKNDESTVEAAAAIYFGLLDLQKKFGKTGDAIWQLKSLFANRLKFEIDDSIITGLLGEIMIIFASANSSLALQHWHSNLDDKFDFSGANFRLEVKSTTANLRNHNFSSAQIPGNVPDKTYIASVQIVRVENGYTLLDVISDVQKTLSSDEAFRLQDVAQRTVGVPTQLLTDYQIDLKASVASIKILRGVDVPAPLAEEGVLSMNWLANLAGAKDLESFYEDFFERHS
jgi:hypothetical protein